MLAISSTPETWNHKVTIGSRGGVEECTTELTTSGVVEIAHVEDGRFGVGRSKASSLVWGGKKSGMRFVGKEQASVCRMQRK